MREIETEHYSENLGQSVLTERKIEDVQKIIHKVPNSRRRQAVQQCHY